MEDKDIEKGTWRITLEYLPDREYPELSPKYRWNRAMVSVTDLWSGPLGPMDILSDELGIMFRQLLKSLREG